MKLERLPKYGAGCVFVGFGSGLMISSQTITNKLLEIGYFYLPKLSGGFVFVTIGLLVIWFSSASKDNISKSLEEKLQNKIDNLESQIAEKSAEIEDLKLQHSLDKRGDTNGHGALSIIIKMRADGKTEPEIAHFLKDNELSYSQVGVLLHGNPLNVTDSAISLHAKRLLGIV